MTQDVQGKNKRRFRITSHRRQIVTNRQKFHYRDLIMSAMVSQITSLTIVYSTVYSATDQISYRSSAPLAFVWGIQRWRVNFPHKWPVTRKMFPFDDVIILSVCFTACYGLKQALHDWPFMRATTRDLQIPLTTASHAESVLMSWRYHRL